MMSGMGLITKTGKLGDVAKIAANEAGEIGDIKVLKALDDAKKPSNKALRTVANEKAMKELVDEVGYDFITDHADEVSDIAKFDKVDPTAEFWKKLRERGQKFDKKVADLFPPKYSYHQVRVEVVVKVKGKDLVKEYFLDSYEEGMSIVSRKATDFNKITEETFKGYCNELLRKYPVGAKIATAKKDYNQLLGKTLQGTPTIEVPKVNKMSSRLKEFQKIADEKGIKLVFESE